MLYVVPASVGADKVSIPVGSVQVGCVTDTIGATGVAGCGAMVIFSGSLTQPSTLVTVTLYVPGKRLLNTVDV